MGPCSGACYSRLESPALCIVISLRVGLWCSILRSHHFIVPCRYCVGHRRTVCESYCQWLQNNIIDEWIRAGRRANMIRRSRREGLPSSDGYGLGTVSHSALAVVWLHSLQPLLLPRVGCLYGRSSALVCLSSSPTLTVPSRKAIHVGIEIQLLLVHLGMAS